MNIKVELIILPGEKIPEKAIGTLVYLQEHTFVSSSIFMPLHNRERIKLSKKTVGNPSYLFRTETIKITCALRKLFEEEEK